MSRKPPPQGTWKRNTSAAHAAKRRLALKARAALSVPRGFSNVDDFIRRGVSPLLTSLPLGAGSALSTEVECSPSTLSKYLRLKKRPSQTNLSRLAAWYDRETSRSKGRLPKTMPKASPEPRVVGHFEISLA